MRLSLDQYQRRIFNAAMFTVAMIVANGSCGSAQAGTVVVVTEQDRSINGWVWIGGCQQHVQNIAAPDYGPFNESVALDPDCALGDSSASSSQQSQMVDGVFTAVGEGTLYGATTQNNVIHGSARSQFDVTFEVAVARDFTIAGFISAARQSSNMGGGHFVITTVQLIGPSGMVFIRSVQPSLNQTLSKTIDVDGTLQPGSYLISVNGQTYMDQAFNNNWVQGDVAFDITLAIVPRAGDVTDDGAVNVNDLLAVINHWGPCARPCPPSCAADATADCTVNLNDLLMVINNWD